MNAFVGFYVEGDDRYHLFPTCQHVGDADPDVIKLSDLGQTDRRMCETCWNRAVA